MEILLQFLGTVHPLSNDLRHYLLQHIKEKNLKKREFLLKSGQVCRSIYFIEQGLLRCYYLKGELEVCSWFMKEGDVMTSISSFFMQSPSHENIQALENCSLYYITYDELIYIYNNFSEFNFIGRELITRYYVLWDQILYGIRMQQAQERYQWLLTKHAELALRVPAKYLASYLDNRGHSEQDKVTIGISYLC